MGWVEEDIVDDQGRDCVELYPLDCPFSDAQLVLFNHFCKPIYVEEKCELVLTQSYFEARDIATYIFNNFD